MLHILERLFDTHWLWAKDRYEIRQIFELLPEEKKQNILNNFSTLAVRIHKIQQDLRIEQEILIWNAVDNIREVILKVKNK